MARTLIVVSMGKNREASLKRFSGLEGTGAVLVAWHLVRGFRTRE